MVWCSDKTWGHWASCGSTAKPATTEPIFGDFGNPLLHLLETNADSKRKSEQGDVLNRWSGGKGIYFCTFLHLSEIVEEWPDRCDRVQLMCLGPKEFSGKLAHGVQMCAPHVCVYPYVFIYWCMCVCMWERECVQNPSEMEVYDI